ncbi:hypothetical protein TIFTF001_035680 [Ficus carica]|uniref:Uncharacterized protein n=1 Tax=Ficus carica TaxID=3494 RepID=A0AA88E611_FICCA|nr:hypothetical protein TIFTF001_035680 [Ficus carica]
MARRSETRKKVGDLLRPYLPDLPFNGHQHNLLGMRLVREVIPTQNEPPIVHRDLRARAVPSRRDPTNMPSLLNVLGVLDEGRRRKNSPCQEYVAPLRVIKPPPPRRRRAPSAASHRAPSAACHRNPSAASRWPSRPMAVDGKEERRNSSIFVIIMFLMSLVSFLLNDCHFKRHLQV